ncbi:MAG TPA: glycosyltransferase family 2 protein [Bacteroidota bacterium]|jgi:glycosyltransferase involved in cell wall biosynthesis|nr:glycosyltransferase family 2 protein [Bacteroidota bacterium]
MADQDQEFQQNPPESAPSEPQFPAPPPPVQEPSARTEQPPQQQQEQRQDRRRDRNPRNQRRHDQPQGQRREPRHDQQQHRQGGLEISIVIPLYNEEQSLRELHEKIRNALHRFNRYEIIFVDDGSTDGSFRVLQELRQRDRRVKIIRFRRNFGKSAALSVGFAQAEGSFVITMDADLQDDPNEIPSLVNELKKGTDLVSGWKKKRRDPISKTIPSKFFNFVTSVMTGIRLHDFNCGLKGYKKDVVKEVRIYGELHRYIPVLAHWLGFKVGEIPVQHHARKYGKTKFGFGRFWKGFLDLLTVLFTTRYLQRPLHLFGFWGIVFLLAGTAIDGYLVFLKFVEGFSLSNRPLFTAGILLIIVGVQFISIGLIGEMISKTRSTSEKEYSIREVWK